MLEHKISDAKIEAQTAGLGKVFLQPRQVADLAYRHGVTDFYDLGTAVAVCKAESQYGVDAWHDNLDASGNVTSRDVGLWQINIPAAEIGTTVETNLYDPEKNAAAMFKLYQARGFQPWAAFNSRVYLNDGYSGHAALGLCNLAVWSFNNWGATLPLPLFSTKDLRAKLT
jgi:hypothetical protein